jgi:hypothetical protein
MKCAPWVPTYSVADHVPWRSRERARPASLHLAWLVQVCARCRVLRTVLPSSGPRAHLLPGAGAEAVASGTASATTAAGRSRSQEHSLAEAEGGHAESASLAGHAICKIELLSWGLGVQQWPQRRMQSAQGEQSGGISTWRRR